MAGSVEQAHHNPFLGMDFGVVFSGGGDEGGGAEDVSALASSSPRSSYAKWYQKCKSHKVFRQPR